MDCLIAVRIQIRMKPVRIPPIKIPIGTMRIRATVIAGSRPAIIRPIDPVPPRWAITTQYAASHSFNR